MLSAAITIMRGLLDSGTLLVPRAWYEQPRDTVSAHGDTAIVFVNDVVTDALDGEPRSSWPAGSVIVKDVYEDGDKSLIAAMRREQDGWFFAEWEPDGEPEYAGFELDVCTDCSFDEQ